MGAAAGGCPKVVAPNPVPEGAGVLPKAADPEAPNETDAAALPPVVDPPKEVAGGAGAGPELAEAPNTKVLVVGATGAEVADDPN